LVFPGSLIGAVQFNSDYSRAGGEFDGLGPAVVCAKPAGFGALEAFNDDDAGQILSQGFADNLGFGAPKRLSMCRFVDADGIAPAPADFVNTTTDCSDLASMQAACFIGVKSVTPCSCGDGAINCVTETCDDGPGSDSQTCGDGIVNCSACTSEDCDDGNAQDDGNGCSADCKDVHVCGNGIVESVFEQCDDGGVCRFGGNAGAPCTLPAGSECMGGFCQAMSGDGCSAGCVSEAALRCGDADGNGNRNATDALLILDCAVGARACETAICDVDGNGKVAATDALAVLRAAVGERVLLSCRLP